MHHRGTQISETSAKEKENVTKHKQYRKEAIGETTGFGSPNTRSAGNGPSTLSGTRLPIEYRVGGSKSSRESGAWEEYKYKQQEKEKIKRKKTNREKKSKK
jgi:hypothetical protein